MTLKETAVGQTVKVKKLTGEGPVKRRIMDMGITKGVPPVGAPAPSTRSTADEVSPPAWPWLPHLLLRRQGR